MRPLDPRLRPYLRPARREIAVLVGGSVAGGVLLIVQAVALAATVARLVADPAGGDWHTPAVVFATALTVRALLGVLVDRASARAADRVGAGLRARVLHAALRGAGPAGRGGAGSDQALLATRGVRAVEPYLTRYLPALVLAGVLPALTVVAIGWLDLWSALVVVLTLPLVPVFAILIGLTTRERADRQWRVLGQLAGHFVDVVRGLPTLVAHRRAGAQAPVIRAVTDRYRRANTDVLRLAFSSSAALELIATISVALVAVLVGLRLAGGGLELEVALAVLLLAPEAYWPLRRVGAEFHAAAEGTATFEAILALEQDDVGDDDAAREPLPPGDLVVTGLRLRHPGAPRPVVDGPDLRAPVRGLTVLSGPSGCGKTTLLEAIAGAMPLEAGTIALEPADGLDGDLGSELGSERWRRSVAVSTQRPWLVEGSIAENLRIGAPEAGDADLWTVLREVELAEVVAHSPGGLDAALGEDGAGLSAGQHARLALARVLLSDRPVVLLDEPTAHLDAATETIVLRVLRRLAEQRCVIAVAHRAALLEAADVVVRLDAPPAPPRPAAGRPGSLGALPVSSPRGERPAPVSAETATAIAATRGGARARWALATLLGTASSLCGVALTATAGWLIVRASEQPPVLMLMVAIVGVRAFGLGRPALRYAERLVSHDVALRELAERRARIYDVLVPLVPARLGGTDGRRRGELMTALVDDVDSLLDERLRVRMPLVACVGVLVVAGLVTLPLLPAAAAAALTLATLSALAAWSTARIATRRRAQAEIDARADLGTAALAAIDDADQLRAWDAGRAAIARVDAAGTRLGRTATAMADAVAWARCWPQLAAAAGVLAVAALGAGALAEGAVSGPILALLLLLPLALAEVVAPLADAGALRVRTRAAAERIDSLARIEPAVVDPPHPAATPSTPIEVDLVGARARWDDDAREVGPFDVTLTPGARLGVVGPSGSGKSTLAALLVRFLAPSAGEHRLGGTGVERLTGDQVRSLVGLVDDDPYLFASTVAENLRLARPGCSDAEIVRALQRARLDEWLAALPQGLDTRIGDGGRSVSGGERARLGLARALLADTPVLVLDEPTAHLDTATARAVADDLVSAARGRSVVWISHDRVGLEHMHAVLDLGAPAPVAAASAMLRG